MSTSALRLVRVELHPLLDGGTLALTPRGGAFRIAAPRDAVEDVLSRCDGLSSIEQVIDAAGVSVEFAEVIELLAGAGCLVAEAAAPGEQHWVRFPEIPGSAVGLTRARIILLGDTDLVGLAQERRLLPSACELEMVGAPEEISASLAKDHKQLIAVALRDHLDVDWLERLDVACAAAGAWWTQLHLAEECGWLGPAITPGATPDYRDLLARRRCAAPDPEVFTSLISAGPAIERYRPPATELVWMLSILFVEIERWLAGAPCSLLGNELEADPVQLRTVLHPVLPLYTRKLPAMFCNPVIVGADLLVDERTGILTSVTRFEHGPGIPETLTTFIATVADTSRVCPWAVNPVGGSAMLLGDPARVRQAAIGEALERYCGNLIATDRLIEASYDDLTRRGECALDPAAVVLYSERQYATPGFPFIPFTRDLRVRWIRGESVTYGTEVWLPASLVYVNWFSGPFEHEPPTNFAIFSGMACGSSREAAMCAGVEELIEREATMVWWANLPLLDAVDLTPRLQGIWEGVPTELGLRGWLIHLDNRFGVPVMAGMVEDRRAQLLTTGFAARADPVEAALKAWSEALTSLETSRDLLDEGGIYRAEMAAGRKHAPFIKPWRADRRYLDSFRPDFRDVCDLESQAQVFLDPRSIARVRNWLDPPATRCFDTLPHMQSRSFDSYREPLEAAGHEVLVADLTTADVAACGMSVVRVIVPGLAGNFPAAFPFLGRRRLQDEAVTLGWRETPLAEEALNGFPLPHV